MEDVKVLYILAFGRSGSTILDRSLGRFPLFFSTGELWRFWRRLQQEGSRCGCGELLVECPVWVAVRERVDAMGFGSIDGDDVFRWQMEALRLHHLGKWTRRKTQPAFGSSSADSYGALLAATYRAIADVTGARVIVDSSKLPTQAAALPLLPRISPYVVHLVRDPRAVAFSWRRQKAVPDRSSAGTPLFGSVASTARWVGYNAAAEVVHRRYSPKRWRRLRYEDFMGDPEATLNGLANELDRDARLSGVSQDLIDMEASHTVFGNPNRFDTGKIRLRRDDEWMTGQSKVDRWTSTILASPLLRRYGYRLNPRKGSIEMKA
ncbi:MAG: sulfotransferase family protein [Actinomycetota bacterium]